MSEELLIWSEHFSEAPLVSIGGKCRGLGWLQRESLDVPRGFCVTSHAFDRFAEANGLFPAADSLSSLSDVITGSDIPADLGSALTLAGTTLAHSCGITRFAVRSSFGTEDSYTSLAAGQYGTVLDVELTELSRAVRQVWASAFSASAVSYRLAQGLDPHERRLAVLVQPYIQAVLGGIVSTMNPETGDIAITTIESGVGQPETLTSAEAPCNRYLLSKTNLACIHSVELVVGARVPLEMLQRLVVDCKLVERFVDAPIGVEWCSPVSGKLLYLQARVLPVSLREESESPMVSEASESPSRSPKIRAAGLKAAGQAVSHVIGPSAFAAFARQRSMDDELEQVLAPVFRRYLSMGPVSVRPAFWSALQSGDLLPQSGRLTSMVECFRQLSDLWLYVLEAGLLDYTAQVACLVGNWLPVYASAVAVADGANRGTVVIHALYGFLEGLERYTHDVYVVALDSLEVLDIRIADKQLGVYSRERGAEEIPQEAKTQAVLRTDELRTIAALTKAAMSSQGQIRIEALVTEKRGPDSIVPWQVEDSGIVGDVTIEYLLVPQDEQQGIAIHSGQGVVIRSETTVPELSDFVSPILILGIEGRLMRDRQWINHLGDAARKVGAVVAFEGSILSHFAATLREFGVTVYPVRGPLGACRTGDRVAILRA